MSLYDRNINDLRNIKYIIKEWALDLIIFLTMTWIEE